jgi:hypothetical protein
VDGKTATLRRVSMGVVRLIDEREPSRFVAFSLSGFRVSRLRRRGTVGTAVLWFRVQTGHPVEVQVRKGKVDLRGVR